MNRIFLLWGCVLTASCVLGDCVKDCYIFQLKPETRLTLKCETTPFHPHCENA